MHVATRTNLVWAVAATNLGTTLGCFFFVFMFALPVFTHRPLWKNEGLPNVSKTQDFNIIEEHRAAQKADMYLRSDKTRLEN